MKGLGGKEYQSDDELVAEQIKEDARDATKEQGEDYYRRWRAYYSKYQHKWSLEARAELPYWGKLYCKYIHNVELRKVIYDTMERLKCL